MISHIMSAIPWWVYLLGIYIGVSAYASARRRIVWLPVVTVIPLLFLAAQYNAVLSLTHEEQLIAILFFLAGVGLGGSVWRPVIIRSFSGLRFEIAGDLISAILLVTIFLVKFAASVYIGMNLPYLTAATCASAFVGVFVPGAFIGRSLFLFARLDS